MKQNLHTMQVNHTRESIINCTGSPSFSLIKRKLYISSVVSLHVAPESDTGVACPFPVRAGIVPMVQSD